MTRTHNKNALPFEMADDAVYFVPLGGCGMFGANLALYGHKGQWIMVDCGMGFADDTMPGVDILMPDPSFAESLGDALIAIVITHGHEDHIGALQHLWPRLKAPVYATPFTAARIRNAVDETDWSRRAKLHEVPVGGRLTLGPFDIRYIRMAHSIPEAHALAIKVPGLKSIVHTGDWKIDPAPVVGEITDGETLAALGAEGVLAVLGDSTNAMVPGHSGSEGDIAPVLSDLFSEFRRTIVLSCFSTNIARLKGVYDAARRNGRQVCLIGRSLWAADDAARRTGYLKDVPPFLDADSASVLPPHRVVYVCTGSQGEPRAALARIAGGDHPDVRLGDGDVVIFSSRAIPGNERAIDRVKNNLYAQGAAVVTDRDARIHVSGHPYREELKTLYAWLKPQIALPVHGEAMQQEKHAQLARDCGVPETLIPLNGRVVELSADGAREVAEVKSGILALEGRRLVAVDHEAILTRRRIMFNGSAVVTIVVDAKGRLAAEPRVTAMGLLDENSDLDAPVLQKISQEIAAKIKNLPAETRADDDALSEAVRIAARRFFTDLFDRKPQTRVHLVRI